MLFGILEESQVGIDSATGRRKIADEVLEEMRRYLLTDTGDSQTVKVDRIKTSIKQVEKDFMTQRLTLRLEAPPEVTSDLNRGKGLVFDYREQSGESRKKAPQSNQEKFMAASFKAHETSSYQFSPIWRLKFEKEVSDGSCASFSTDYPTVFKAGCDASGSTGIVKRRPTIRKRPPKAQRQLQAKQRGYAKQRDWEESREEKQLLGSKKKKVFQRRGEAECK